MLTTPARYGDITQAAAASDVSYQSTQPAVASSSLLIMAASQMDYDLLAHWAEIGLERGPAAKRPVHGAPIGNGMD